MLKLTWSQAANWRIGHQHLDRRAAAGSLLAVASRLCGLHAQLMSSAELSAWARVENLERDAVQRALWQDRTLVKTWAMRGTLHLLPADELPQWHAALATSRRYLRASAWEKYFGITLEQLDQLTAAIAAALHGQVMTREELVREIVKITGSAAIGAKIAESSWGTILKPAAFAGHLCFGPSLGQRVRFTRPDTWLAVKAPLMVEPEAALLWVTRRFLAAYGPATFHDLARWWGGNSGVSNARQWISSLGKEVSAVEVDGTRAWMIAEDAADALDLPAVKSVRLLPGFDPYVIAASHHAEQLLPNGLRGRVYRPQGWVSPVLLVNGRMEGIWRHAIKGSRIEVAIEPFGNPPVWVRRAAGQEAKRLAAFLGGTLNLVWKT
jgi:hypothetical protein